LVLAVVVGLLVYFLQPPTQDQLYAAWQNAGGPDAKLRAAERYLDRFGSIGDEKAEKVRGSLREIRGERLQEVLDKRFRNRNAAFKITTAQEGEDEQAYTLAWSGMEAEDKGDMATALGFWGKLKTYAPSVNDRYGDGWLWVAEKHVEDIKSVDTKLAELR